MKNLQGKVAAITGAGSGIGRELALQLSAKGAIVAINDFNATALAETQKMLAHKGATCSTHVFDVSKKEKVYGFAEEVIKEHGQVDIVLNNAGTSLSTTSIMDMTDEDVEYIFGINLWGVIYGTKAFLPYLMKRPEASLVNISSVFGMMGAMGQGPYVMSKFAVRGFTETLRMEILDSNVCVTQVHPGGIDTNIVRNSRFREGEDKEAFAKKFKKVAPTSPHDAAKKIIKGIQGKKWRVLIGSDARQIDIMTRLFPTGYTSMIRNQLNKAEEG